MTPEQIINWAQNNAQTENEAFSETRYVGLVDGATYAAQQAQPLIDALEEIASGLESEPHTIAKKALNDYKTDNL